MSDCPFAAEADPFKQARREGPVLPCEFQGETVPMILRHADVRAAAKDWKTYSSDAPVRVPIPSEEDVRSMRQLPIETDPPEHTEYRKIVEPFFKRAKEPEVMEKVETLIGRLVDEALGRESIEIVREFALPLQSHALTYLLNCAETEADTWTGWGVHVFRDGGDGARKGQALEDYLHGKFDDAEAAPGEDFFSALTQATYQGRRLTREEMMGYANLAFAGGRDTIIHSVSSVVAHFARNQDDFEFVRQDPKRVVHAAEEFFRVYMPLTHIGRVCPVDTDVHGFAAPAGGRVSLGWASANRDETVFEAAEEIRLDRKPNPHLAFGFGAHLCLGAPHARLIVRTLLKTLGERVARIELIEAVDHVEEESAYARSNGYESLKVKLTASA